MADAFDNLVNSNLSFLNQPMWAMALGAFFAFYSGFAAPALPNSILKLFNHGPFRLAYLFLLMWSASQQPTLALMTAVAFVVTMNVLAERNMFELFEAHMEHNNAMPLSGEKELPEEMIDNHNSMPNPVPVDM